MMIRSVGDDSQFIYDQETAEYYHGKGVMVHLGAGVGDPSSLDTILDHAEELDNWILSNNRIAEMAQDQTVGLCWAEDGSPFVDKLYVVVSKPNI